MAVRVYTGAAALLLEPFYQRGSFAVVREPGCEWSVTHVPSGQALLFAASKRAAVRACKRAWREIPSLLDALHFGEDPRTRFTAVELHLPHASRRHLAWKMGIPW